MSIRLPDFHWCKMLLESLQDPTIFLESRDGDSWFIVAVLVGHSRTIDLIYQPQLKDGPRYLARVTQGETKLLHPLE